MVSFTRFMPEDKSLDDRKFLKHTYLPMTPEEREEMVNLCKRISTEKDFDAFTKLIDQLNDLLSRRDGHHGIRDRPKK
jgi:hypothetical protein